MPDYPEKLKDFAHGKRFRRLPVQSETGLMPSATLVALLNHEFCMLSGTCSPRGITLWDIPASRNEPNSAASLEAMAQKLHRRHMRQSCNAAPRNRGEKGSLWGPMRVANRPPRSQNARTWLLSLLHCRTSGPSCSGSDNRGP